MSPRTMRRVLHAPQHNRVSTGRLRELFLGSGASDIAAYTFDGCTVLVAREPLGPAGELQWHLSISREDRYPDWDEIAHARYALLPDAITFAMLLPPRSEYVNAHDHCFHLHEIPSGNA